MGGSPNLARNSILMVLNISPSMPMGTSKSKSESGPKGVVWKMSTSNSRLLLLEKEVLFIVDRSIIPVIWKKGVGYMVYVSKVIQPQGVAISMNGKPILLQLLLTF